MFAHRQSPRSRSLRALAALGVALSLTSVACSDDTDDALPVPTTASESGDTTTTTEYVTPEPMGDIVATALTNQVFTQLAGLATDAGLVDDLRGGPFTVFAPTDAAFDRLVFDGLGELIEPAGTPSSDFGTADYERMAASAQILRNVQKDPALVTNILLHHVVAGAIAPDDMVEGELTTLLGDTLAVTRVGEQWFVDGYPVGAGVEATNGWVYVMSDVMVPNALGNVVEVATALNGTEDDVVQPFATLIDAVIDAGLADALATTQDITVFAPVDSAFTPAVLAAISGRLSATLQHHVVPQRLTLADLLQMDGETITDLAGGELRIRVEDGEVYVNDVQLQVRNVPASNGVIHVIASPLGD